MHIFTKSLCKAEERKERERERKGGRETFAVLSLPDSEVLLILKRGPRMLRGLRGGQKVISPFSQPHMSPEPTES